MRHQTLGTSGLRVTEMALGTMTFGTEWGWGADRNEAQAQFDAFREAGGNHIDTANLYTGGTAERWVGEMIKGDRDRWVVATKYTLATRDGEPNHAGSGRKHMMHAVKASMERLQTDHIDLYWVHAWDQVTPAEEVLRGLDDLVSRGLVHHIGISDSPAWVVSRLVTMAEERGWSTPIATQIQYSLARRSAERELLPMAHNLGLGITAWSVLARGLLTSKYASAAPGTKTDRRLDVQGHKVSAEEERVLHAVREVAEELDATPAQVAIQWVLDRKEHIIPILGATRGKQMEEALGALQVALNADQHRRLDAASRIEMGFPTDFLETDRVRRLVVGGTGGSALRGGAGPWR